MSDSGKHLREPQPLILSLDADDTRIGDTLDEEAIEVDAEPQEDGGGGSKTNVRIELDQNSMTDVICKDS